MNQALLQRIDRGSPAWWREVERIGTPLFDFDAEDMGAPDVAQAPAPTEVQVTFLWRDPRGDEHSSPTRRVWLNITGRTDHHHEGLPQSLERLPGTDVWAWQTSIESDWRGSYSFMPQDSEHVFADAGRDSLRAFWQKMFPSAQPDALNRGAAWQGQRGLAVSPLHMPQAPAQRAWETPTRLAQAAPGLQEHQWHSARLGNRRRVWLLSTGEREPANRPLAIILDGAFWALTMPLAAPLQCLTDEGRLPEAVYLFIDSIDTDHRNRELPCNPDFWEAVQHELLPLARQWTSWHDSARDCVVVGQSFGGLAAVYAALHWPQVFGAALSLSGSFWWPRPDEAGEGLLGQIERGLGDDLRLDLYLQAGRREPQIHRVNDRLVEILEGRGQAVTYWVYNGGHDALCWRGGLLDGLVSLWRRLATGPAMPRPE
jgi:enterochelin esterase family protein